MNFLGNVLGMLILGLIFSLMISGDELLCSMSEDDIQAYELCLELEECIVDGALVTDYVSAKNAVVKYCDD